MAGLIPIQWANMQKNALPAGNYPTPLVVTLLVTNAAPFNFPLPRIFTVLPMHVCPPHGGCLPLACAPRT